jgi:hypothetical protein
MALEPDHEGIGEPSGELGNHRSRGPQGRVVLRAG